MTKKIEDLIRYNNWEMEDTEKEITRYLTEIKDYAMKALEMPADDNRGENVRWIENSMKHLAEAQAKLDNLKEMQRRLEWVLE